MDRWSSWSIRANHGLPWWRAARSTRLLPLKPTCAGSGRSRGGTVVGRHDLGLDDLRFVGGGRVGAGRRQGLVAAQVGDAIVGHHVQLRCQQLRVAVEVKRLLDEEAKLARQLQPVVACNLGDVQHQVLDLRLVDAALAALHGVRRGVAEARQQLADVVREAILVDLANGRTHGHQRTGHAARILLGKGDAEIVDALRDSRREPPDDAEVEEAHTAVLEHEEVAGMHIRMEELALLHRQRPRVQGRHEGSLRVVRVALDAFQVHQRDAPQPSHGEDLVGS
mmetsp:Transcript_23322/g.59537  ORF Transcript_23322/g.59537 Transcript_23322/m.59537 type:complete len:280 (-) Transcript_23322:997-1836(-)